MQWVLPVIWVISLTTKGTGTPPVMAYSTSIASVSSNAMEKKFE